MAKAPTGRRQTARSMRNRRQTRYEANSFGRFALESAAVRATIQASTNFAGSDGGLFLLKSAQAVARISCRLSSALLCFSWSSLHAPTSLSAFTAPLWIGTDQFLVWRFAAMPIAPGAPSL